MRCVFLIDPVETLNLKKDTSYLLMQEVQSRGHQIFILYKDHITVEDQSIWFHVFTLEITNDQYSPFVKGEKVKLPHNQIDVLLIRTDPPFDEVYLSLTWFLDLIQRNVFILNHPSGIRDVNEKIGAHYFPELTPPTLITTQKKEYNLFLQKHEKIVVKPTNGFAGKNVFVTHKNDSNAAVIFESVLEVSGYAIVQKYLVESELGDKRITLLDGEPIGCIMRVHGEKDHRNNFAAGGKAEKAQITSRDKWIIQTLESFLREKKLYLTGIDILGGYLTEINVTSPTCFRETNEVSGLSLEKKVIDFIEKKVHSFQQRSLV